jgi:hypothetical protein
VEPRSNPIEETMRGTAEQPASRRLAVAFDELASAI